MQHTLLRPDPMHVPSQFAWGEFADWYVEAAKARLYGTDEAKEQTRSVLVRAQG